MITFEQKYDGETILVKKMGGEIHLLIKFQIDVYKIENKDSEPTFEFGFY